MRNPHEGWSDGALECGADVNCPGTTTQANIVPTSSTRHYNMTHLQPISVLMFETLSNFSPESADG